MKHSISTFCAALTLVGAVWITSKVMNAIADDIKGSPHPQPPATGFLEREAAIRSQRNAMAVMCPQTAAFDMSQSDRLEDGPKRIWVNGSIP